MDFIERYLHISPDGGSGTTELSYVIAVLVFAFVFRGPLTRLLSRLRVTASRK